MRFEICNFLLEYYFGRVCSEESEGFPFNEAFFDSLPVTGISRGYAVKSHSTILQRLRRQMSLDYYTIPSATQATDLLTHFTIILGSLSNSVFERRTSTGSGRFALLGGGLVETLR